MCKTKALVIGQLLQKNILLVVPEVQIQKKIYRQINYEDTSYKIRIYEDCRSINLKDLKKVYSESIRKIPIHKLKKQDQSLTQFPLLTSQSSKESQEERNSLRKRLKVETFRNVKNLSLESETISALLENDLTQKDEEDLEQLISIFPFNRYEPQVECRRKYKQNITSIIRYLTEKQPIPSEIQQGQVEQISKKIIFQKIQRAGIVLVLLANVISIVWKINCKEQQINT